MDEVQKHNSFNTNSFTVIVKAELLATLKKGIRCFNQFPMKTFG
jgi:hypothetical protein